MRFPIFLVMIAGWILHACTSAERPPAPAGALIAPSGDWIRIVSVNPPSGTELDRQPMTFNVILDYGLYSRDEARLVVGVVVIPVSPYRCEQSPSNTPDSGEVIVRRGIGRVSVPVAWEGDINPSRTLPQYRGFLSLEPSAWPTRNQIKRGERFEPLYYFGPQSEYCYYFSD